MDSPHEPSRSNGSRDTVGSVDGDDVMVGDDDGPFHPSDVGGKSYTQDFRHKMTHQRVRPRGFSGNKG